MNKAKRKRRLRKAIKRRQKELSKMYWMRYWAKEGHLKGEWL